MWQGNVPYVYFLDKNGAYPFTSKNSNASEKNGTSLRRLLFFATFYNFFVKCLVVYRNLVYLQAEKGIATDCILNYLKCEQN